MKTLSEAIKNFSDREKQRESMELLYASISPLSDECFNDVNPNNVRLTKRTLLEVTVYMKYLRKFPFQLLNKLKKQKVFQNSLYEMLRKALGNAADADMTFAWKTFMLDTSPTDIFRLKEKRPGFCFYLFFL